VNRILVIEDEQVIRSALCRLLERNGYQATEAGAIDEARPLLLQQEFDLVIADLRLPGAPGTDVIPLAEGIPVLVMTSYASVRSAVESMKLGAVDYIAKPFDHDEMLLLVERTLARSRLERQKNALKSDLERNYPVTGMVGDCPAMHEAFERIGRVAATDTTVLILGESGTGKELAARAVHENSSRSDAPIITVNCAAIPEGLVESSTRSANSRCRPRHVCCACSSRAIYAVLVPTTTATSTSGWSQRPTATCVSWSMTRSSVRTSTSACGSWRSCCHPCANVVLTSIRSPTSCWPRPASA
jgi:DNA-binding response OmpR family regulator